MPPAPTATDPTERIAQALKLGAAQVQACAALLDEGATVPFIARYRKDRTQNLDEVQILAIQERLNAWRELEERRQSVLKSLQEQGLLTPELAARVAAVTGKTELEDLYLPHRPKRRTRAQMARERGLAPLAAAMRAQQGAQSPEAMAKAFVQGEVGDVAAALAGARDILAEELAETARVRDMAREALWRHGRLVATKGKAAPEGGKYRDHEGYSEALSRIPSHRYLALRRGEKEKALSLRIELDAAPLLARLGQWLRLGPNPWGAQCTEALGDAWKRLLLPSLESEIMAELKARSDATAIEVFATNLREILLAPPLGGQAVLGLDPGLRTGVKTVVLGPTGQHLEHTVLHTLRQDGQAKAQFLALVKKHRPMAVAVGDGTGGRETEAWARACLREAQLEAPPLVVRVSEAGASIYSASAIARQEFPDLDLTVRGAISIGRRLQDPLAELVKLPPESIGVGQYQHDVEPKALAKRLDQVVESCVNGVGVELNTASAPLLERVAGLGPKLAAEIVQTRDQAGPFTSRAQLKKVKGLGAKTFEQAAGFLRIRESAHPLDRTAVHPEHYPLVERIAKEAGIPLAQLLQDPEALKGIDWARYASPEVGALALADIRAELEKPGRDPRRSFEAPSFREDVTELHHVQVGMRFEGRVTNVAAFGAFVDIGVHQDGLVHISQLADRFVRNPHDVVKVGQSLHVTVLEVDQARRRIQLSARSQPKA